MTSARTVERSAVRSRETARQRSAALYGLTGLAAWAQVDPELTAIAERAQSWFPGAFFAINIFDGSRMWSVLGVADQPASVSARAAALSDRVLADPVAAAGVYCTSDASTDPLLATSPWVNGDLATQRGFCAVPLIGREGLPLGTVTVSSEDCVTFSRTQQKLLVATADAVMALLDARREPPANEAASHSGLRPLRPLNPLSPSSHSGPGRRQPVAVPDLPFAEILRDGAVRTVCQPVVQEFSPPHGAAGEPPRPRRTPGADDGRTAPCEP